MTPRELALLKAASRVTPVGRALRRYWIPVLPAAKVPEPDGKPVALRVLTEPLVLFVDSSGRIGVIDAYCPHESGSMVKGRNAENGLECMLHGWKFDVEGTRVDSGAIHAGPVKTRAYRAVRHEGVVWIYMGTENEPPELPRGFDASRR